MIKQSAFAVINVLERKEKDLDLWKCRIADYFCEDGSLFKLDECFNILFKFCEKIKKCSQVSGQLNKLLREFF